MITPKIIENYDIMLDPNSYLSIPKIEQGVK